jgi:hypothetical protein
MLTWKIDQSSYACGCAVAQCGKALPYRPVSKGFLEATPPLLRHSLKEKLDGAGKAEPFRTVRRQSRTHVLSGKPLQA